MNSDLAHTLTDSFVSLKDEDEEEDGVCWLKMPTL
jgi:hypothetical protein